jgi:alkylation response protein AidB-like acyl-CoA dehydrogenase
MREKLNSNPMAQVGLIAVLLVLAAVFAFTKMGGGAEEEESAGTAGGEAAASPAVTPPPGALAKAAPPPPRDVTAAFAADRTVVLLFVRHGGIDDRMVAAATHSLASLPGVSTFVVPADRIARYATIAQGVDVNRVPALVVVRPKRLDHGIPTASVSYGFQSPESVVQAVVDAGYKGPTVDYHP